MLPPVRHRCAVQLEPGQRRAFEPEQLYTKPGPSSAACSRQKTPAAKNAGEFQGGSLMIAPIKPRCQARSSPIPMTGQPESRTIIRAQQPESHPDPKVIGEEQPRNHRIPSPNPAGASRTRTISKKRPANRSLPPHGENQYNLPLSAISRYILCLVLYDINIWCYVIHAGLCQPLIFRQFFRYCFLCGRCNILLNYVLFVNK